MMFGDLRDPMTPEEIQADIQLRAEEDRAWREAHPLTLKSFSISYTVPDSVIAALWFPAFKEWLGIRETSSNE